MYFFGSNDWRLLAGGVSFALAGFFYNRSRPRMIQLWFVLAAPPGIVYSVAMGLWGLIFLRGM